MAYIKFDSVPTGANLEIDGVAVPFIVAVNVEVPSVYTGEEVVCKVTFVNIGDTDVTQRVRYGIKGIDDREQEITLKPKETKEITFPFTATADGTYEIYAEPEESWRAVDVWEPDWEYPFERITELGELIH